MNAVTEDIKGVLVTAGWKFGTDLFIASQPYTPVNCVTLYDTSTGIPDNYIDGQTDIRNDSLQVLVRNIGHAAGYAICEQLISTLTGIKNRTISGAKYLYVLLENGPNTLKGLGGNQKDVANDKTALMNQWSINFRIKRQKI